MLEATGVKIEGKEYTIYVDGMTTPSNLDKLAVTMPDGHEVVIVVSRAWSGSADAQPPMGALRARFVK